MSVGAGNDDGSMRGILAKAAPLIDGTEKPPGREEEMVAPALAASKWEKTTIMRSGWAVRALLVWSAIYMCPAGRTQPVAQHDIRFFFFEPGQDRGMAAQPDGVDFACY